MSAWTEDDALAAEYALRTLAEDELGAVEARRQNDPAFAALVQEWAERLAPLLETVPSVEPDARLRESVMREIDRLRVARSSVPEAEATGTVLVLRRQVTRWRLATVMSGGLAALLAIWLATSRFVVPPPPGAYMAVLQQGAGAPAFLISLDLANRRMVVLPVDAAPAPDKSFELWMIGSDTAGPRSLGVVDTPATIRAAMPDVSSDLISKATYAITVEAKGGSPSGKPTSKPVFVGRLVPLDPAARS